MFKIFTRVAKLEEIVGLHDTAAEVLMMNSDNMATRLTALEEYLDIEFFNGPTQKPHYRKTRVITKKMGRPKKAVK